MLVMVAARSSNDGHTCSSTGFRIGVLPPGLLAVRSGLTKIAIPLPLFVGVTLVLGCAIIQSSGMCANFGWCRGPSGERLVSCIRAMWTPSFARSARTIGSLSAEAIPCGFHVATRRGITGSEGRGGCWKPPCKDDLGWGLLALLLSPPLLAPPFLPWLCDGGYEFPRLVMLGAGGIGWAGPIPPVCQLEPPAPTDCKACKKALYRMGCGGSIVGLYGNAHIFGMPCPPC